mmetsp:Transcript_32650/g.77447  ORF Transcript_32650/g.77447 Transcript_32650/m.77447 type:complete len:206 (+) Transcript_32650:1730-2347(+)
MVKRAAADAELVLRCMSVSATVAAGLVTSRLCRSPSMTMCEPPSPAGSALRSMSEGPSPLMNAGTSSSGSLRSARLSMGSARWSAPRARPGRAWPPPMCLGSFGPHMRNRRRSSTWRSARPTASFPFPSVTSPSAKPAARAKPSRSWLARLSPPSCLAAWFGAPGGRPISCRRISATTRWHVPSYKRPTPRRAAACTFGFISSSG